jgi:hypothetical protein
MNLAPANFGPLGGSMLIGNHGAFAAIGLEAELTSLGVRQRRDERV